MPVKFDVKCWKCEATTFVLAEFPSLPKGWKVLEKPDYLDLYECGNHAG